MGVKVTAPSPDPTQRDIDEYLERLRDRQADARPGEPAPPVAGDFVLVDVHGTVHGQAIPRGDPRPGLLAEVGQRSGACPSFDKELEGKRAGEIRQGQHRPAGGMPARTTPARR